MKKLILLFLLAVASLDVHAAKCIDGRSTAVDSTGAIVGGTVEKCYINVVNRSGSTLAAGTVVVWETSTYADGASVTTMARLSAPVACVLTASCTNGKLCNDCQTWGLHTAVLFDSTNGNGEKTDIVYPSSSNAGYVQSTTYGSNSASDKKIGYLFEAASTSGAKSVMLEISK